jgi:asparagine synthase (glutamine-hydrolysing)
MCGIAGVAGGGGASVREPVERMLALLVHRGPDASGVATGEGWAIGARRLAIIDLETGDQPVGNESGQVQAVLNGEIYNYRELREGLNSRGHRLRSRGDSEVLVHLWEELGPEMVGRLRGMFALAVLDTRQRTLFLARDRVGKKPLYWARHGGRLMFASELKALRAALPARPPLDRRALAAYLSFGFVPEGQCIVQGVEKLPPAHWLRLDALTGEVRQHRYWTLPEGPPAEADAGAAAATLLGRLEEAVTLRLRADVPLALFLSGGLDSGLIAALAGRRSAGLRGITIGFAGSHDERPAARATAARTGVALTERSVDPAEGLGLLPRLAEVFDEPLADSSAIPTLLVAQAARAHAKVVLNGDGGDEALGGYRRFLAARLSQLPGAAVVGPPLARLLGALAGPGSRTAAWSGRLAEGLTDPARSYLAWGPVKLAPPEVAALTGQPPSLPPALAALAERHAALDPVRLLGRLELEFFLPGDLLVKMDRATMAVSLEARSPFLDHELLEWAVTVPPALLLRGFRTKAVARQAARGLLPGSVSRGPKRGFEVPLQSWLAGAGAGEVRQVLEYPHAAVRRVLDAAPLARLQRWQQERDPERAARSVFTLLTLEHWLRRWG